MGPDQNENDSLAAAVHSYRSFISEDVEKKKKTSDFSSFLIFLFKEIRSRAMSRRGGVEIDIERETLASLFFLLCVCVSVCV